MKNGNFSRVVASVTVLHSLNQNDDIGEKEREKGRSVRSGGERGEIKRDTIERVEIERKLHAA